MRGDYFGDPLLRIRESKKSKFSKFVIPRRREDASSRARPILFFVAALCLTSQSVVQGFSLTTQSLKPTSTFAGGLLTSSWKIIPSSTLVERLKPSARLHNQPPDPTPQHPSHPKPIVARKDDDSSPYEFWRENLTMAQFNMDLQNLAADQPNQAKDALEIMADFHLESPDHPYTVDPDITCYNSVVEGYITAEQPQQADEMLSKLEEKASSLRPNERTYMLVAQGWANAVDSDLAGRLAERGEQLIERMKEQKLEPSVKVHSIVLEGWCKRAGSVHGAMLRADALLQKMEESNVVRPNVLTYTSYIAGLARCGERNLATRADATLDRMEKHGVTPDMVAYTALLNCWAKATSRGERRQAADRALELLNEMENFYQEENYSCKPSIATYSTAIRAIGHSFDPRAPELAEGVLTHMYDLHENGTIFNLKPVTATYNAVLNALSRASQHKFRYAQRAEELLREMTRRAKENGESVSPDVRTWAAVMKAWAACGQDDAAEQADRVLREMEELYQAGESTVRPNYVCYTQCMGAWGNSKRDDALDRMEDLLIQMEESYRNTSEAQVRPNTVSYLTAIDAFVRKDKKNAAIRAQATVDRMTRLYGEGLGHVRPTTYIFNTLINAWAKSQEPDAASKAEKIFQWMEAQCMEGDESVRPDDVSLSGVLNAWANHGKSTGAERAMQIYQYTESMSVEERGFQLSITMPNIVVKALARSRNKDSVEKAAALLKKLEDDYESGKSSLRPDVTTYSSVINCCAYYRHPEGQLKALDTAVRTFRKVCDSEEESPNNITYGTLFKAISNQMPEGKARSSLIHSLFKRCGTEGMVDGFVLSQLRRASPRQYKELLKKCNDRGKRDIEHVLRSIPKEWSENVVV